MIQDIRNICKLTVDALARFQYDINRNIFSRNDDCASIAAWIRKGKGSRLVLDMRDDQKSLSYAILRTHETCLQERIEIDSRRSNNLLACIFLSHVEL